MRRRRTDTVRGPLSQPLSSGLSSGPVRRIAVAVGVFYYLASLAVFRDVLFAIPSVLRGDAVIVGDELVPFFNPSSQLLEQAQGRFNELTHGYEFRVRYSFLTTWVRHYKVLPFAILLVLPTVFWVVYLTTARFVDRVFTSLSSQAIYLAAVFPTTLIYLVMVYAKVTHFYTLIVGLAMMTVSSLWMLYALLFAGRRWWRYAVMSSVVTLLNPAVHYLILFSIFFAITVTTLAVGECAHWLRTGGPRRARQVPRTLRRVFNGRATARKCRHLVRAGADTTIGRCAVAGVIFVVVALVPYAMFVKFVALRGVPNLSETVPGDYYFIRDASVSWLHVLSWDMAGITDKVLFGDYLAKVPRYPNVVYSLLLLAPLLVPALRRRLVTVRPHRQLLGVVYMAVGFAVWATIGYAEPLWFPTFHRAMAGVTIAANATGSALGGLTLAVTSTIVQVLRFPHRFQLILFMLAPMLMTLTLAWGIDAVSGRWMRRASPTAGSAVPARVTGRGGSAVIRLAATAWVASVFFAPFWSNAPYRQVFGSGDMAGFLAPYPVGDLRELKAALEQLPEGKTVVLPPTETAKLTTSAAGIDHKFIDKFFIYYLDAPSYYYGLTGDARNKFEFFLLLRGIYYQQDWWINVARDIDVRYLVVNRGLRDNRGVGAEYLPNVESYVGPAIERLGDDLELRFQNDAFALYELVDRADPERQTLLVGSGWPTYLDLVFDRLDLSRCYDFEYLPYFDPTAERSGAPLVLLTDDERSSAIDMFLLEHPSLIGRPDSKMFAFNPDVVASSYYLSPMFRSFLFFSNTKWNRTEFITPGVFGSLRGSFIGVPRATSFGVDVSVAEPGRYRVLLRSAVTANRIEVSAPSLGFDGTFELRSGPGHTGLFRVDEVYSSQRSPVDVSALTVDELEEVISSELVPVNAGFAYQDLGTVVVDAAGVHRFTVTKSDSNPMLAEGVMLVPEDIYGSIGLGDDVEVVDDPGRLRCSERSAVNGADDVYVDPAANEAHEDLTQEELLTLAAAGVEDLAPSDDGGVGPAWAALATTALLLAAGGFVVRRRSRPSDTDLDTADRDEPSTTGDR